MLVSVVRVRNVGMLVRQWNVAVPVGMGFGHRHLVFVLVVFVVEVAVRVFHHLVSVQVAVTLPQQ